MGVTVVCEKFLLGARTWPIPRKKSMANRPVESFRVASGIEAAIWENEGKEGATYFNVTFKRSYFDKDAEDFKETSSYGERDCVSLAHAALLAQAWIGERMRDRAEKKKVEEKVEEKPKGRTRERAA